MLKAIEFSGSQPSLPQYAAQDTYRYFSMAWDDRSEHPFVVLFYELDVAAPLTGLNEAGFSPGPCRGGLPP